MKKLANIPMIFEDWVAEQITNDFAQSFRKAGMEGDRAVELGGQVSLRLRMAGENPEKLINVGYFFLGTSLRADGKLLGDLSNAVKEEHMVGCVKEIYPSLGFTA